MRSPTGTALINMKNRDAIVNPTQNLVNALKTKSFSRIRSAIKMPCVDLNYRDPDNECRTPLVRVCAMDMSATARRDLARILLNKQVDINARDVHGMTALAIACRGGDAGMVRLLAEDVNVDPNLADLEGNTPLMHACRFGEAETVTALITSFKRFGLRVDETNNEGVTPLIEAARAGNADICRTLVQEGQANVNVRDNASFSTAMDFAIASGRCSTPELLLLSPVAQRKLKARQQREAMGHKTLKDVIMNTNMHCPRTQWVKPTNNCSSRYETLPLPAEYVQQVNSMVFQVGKRMQRLSEDPEGESREEAELEEEQRRAPVRRRYSLPSARHCIYGASSNKLQRNPTFHRQTASGSPRLSRGGRGKPDWLKLPPVPETTLSRSPSPTDRKSESSNKLTPPESPKSVCSLRSPPRSPTQSPEGATTQKTDAILPANCRVQAHKVSHAPSIASSSYKRPNLRISHMWEGRPSNSVPSYLFR